MNDGIAGWLLALAISGALIPWSTRERRGDAVGAFALLLLYVVALAVAGWLLEPVWRPWAPAIAAAAVWLAFQPLLALDRLTRADVGLVPLRPGSARTACIVTAIALVLNAVIVHIRGPAAMSVSGTLIAAVLLAAMVEELVFRGVILALADRAHPPRWNLWGASIGLGGLAVTAAFVTLHGVRPGLLLGVAPAAILYLWLRARTGSLLAPIAAHVLWNLSIVLMHR
jgi:membrane protease YdiL (CAAX protease family)